MTGARPRAGLTFTLVARGFALLALLASAPAALAEEPPESRDVGWWQDVDLKIPGLLGKWHIYQKNGLRVDSPTRDLRLKFNASLFADGGYIGANDAVQTAFPQITGWNALLSRARVTMRGWLFDIGDFRFQIEFAQKFQIADSWFGFKPLPYVGRIRIGNMTEPFSLDNMMSSSDLAFISTALPTLAFVPGRNIGVMAQNAVLDKRMTWAFGGFWNTASYDAFLGAKDALSNSIGFDLTGRITGLPVYGDEGRRLVHLGLSFSYQWVDDEVQTRAAPETTLTDEYLVNTGFYRPSRSTLLNPEFGAVSGPWTFQGEFFLSADRAAELGNPRLWGFYVFASHILTGEYRRYDRETGVFGGVVPRRNFSLRDGGGGAWEVAVRLSHVNLNGSGLGGGRQTDLTAGLNWYFNPTTRLMFNYVRARVQNRTNPPVLDNGTANIFQARLQIDF